jgi:hypothetical protein
MIISRGLRRLTLLAAVLIMPLASCDVLFMGTFPRSVTQMSAQVDLSAEIRASAGGYFALTDITAGGFEYVLLYSSVPFDGSQPHLIVMDPALHVLSRATLDELTALPTAGVPFKGNVAMRDCSDNIVIGNVLFSPQPDGLSFVGKSSTTSLDGPSASGRPLYSFNEINFRISSYSGAPYIAYDEFDPGWSSTGAPPDPPPPGQFREALGAPSPPAQGYLTIDAILSDPDSGPAPDLFVFRDSGPGRVYIVSVPKIDVDGGLSVVEPGDFFSYYTMPVVKDNISGASLCYSRDGLIAYDDARRSLVHFNLAAPDVVSALPYPAWSPDSRVVSSLSGAYCYVWDPNSRSIMRIEKWW